MEFSYTYTPTDLAAAQRFVGRAKGPLGRANRAIGMAVSIVFVLSVVVGIGVGVAMGGGLAVDLVWAIVAALTWLGASMVAMALVLGWMNARQGERAIRQLAEQGELDPFPARVGVRFGDDGLEMSSSAGRSLYRWQGIRGVERVGNQLFVSVNALLCLFVQLDTLEAGVSPERIEAECRARVLRARGGSVAPPTVPGEVGRQR